MNGAISSASKTGKIVILFTDLVESVGLKTRLGTETYAEAISRHDALFRDILSDYPQARILQDTGDGFYARFEDAAKAVETALRFQKALRAEPWGHEPLKVRIGVNVARVTELVREPGTGKLIGLPIDLSARLMGLAEGGQILLTRLAFDGARQTVRAHPATGEGGALPRLAWVAHGPYLFRGYEEPLEVFEVGAKGSAPLRPPKNSANARRVITVEEAELLGWRPAAALHVPHRDGWVLESKLGEGSVGEVWVARRENSGERHVFKFCFDAQKLRSLRRELTLIRLIQKSLGERRDIVGLYDPQLESPPYFLEREFSDLGDLANWAQAQGGIEQLPLATRLEILAGSAEAVAAAHSIGILHKDLKPMNILMAQAADGEVYPQLADFGIGELTDPSSLENAGITAMGFSEAVPVEERLGYTTTRMYAPPETLAGKPFTIQGDIYALGVMLYQLVTADFARPLAPGWERGIEDELLREDIAQCVDGDPARRFASATDLADRVRNLEQRHRAREAARRKIRQEARRRRGIRFAAAAAAALVVVVGLVTTAFIRERDLRLEAELAQALAKRESAKAKAVSNFLQSMLASVDPANTQGREVSVREVLDEAAVKLNEKNPFTEQPVVEAAVRTTLGNAYTALGKYALAEPHLDRALKALRQQLGDDHPNTIATTESLAILYDMQGRYEQAEPLYVKSLEAHRRAFGVDHPKTLASMNNLGVLYLFRGRYDEAEKLFSKALAGRRRVLGEDHQQTLASLTNLAILYDALGRYDEAAALSLKALETGRRTMGENHPQTLLTLSNLALTYEKLGRYGEAEQYNKQVLEARRRVLGEDHPDTLASMNNLAVLYQRQGKDDEAERLYVKVLAARRHVLGEDHPDTLVTLSNLAVVYEKRGQYDKAIGLNKKALEARRRLLGENHPDTLTSLSNLAVSYGKQERFAEGEPLYIGAFEARRRVLGEDHPDTLTSLSNLGVVYEKQGRFNEAEHRYLAVLGARRRVLGKIHPDTLRSLNDLARLYHLQKRYPEAEKLYLEQYHAATSRYGHNHDNTVAVMQSLVKLYRAWGKLEKVRVYQKMLPKSQVP